MTLYLCAIFKNKITMKNTKLLVGILAVAGTLSVFAASKKDPVLMTVAGKPVTLSEFEYMYHKNNQQQAAQQPLDKYLKMFTTYKLKVADAEAAGIDTTAAFKREFEGYRSELAMPYLHDSAAEEAAMREIYERLKYNVRASHIMLPLGRDIKENNARKARLDSIRACALNGESFDSLAVKFSADRSAVRNHGDMGFVSVGVFPYEFEDACYSTPEGEISEPFRTNYGWHIVKTFERRPDAGEVLVEHILKLYPRNATEEQKAQAKHAMDSIYELVKNDADFEALARKESQDPGTARNGGKLPWFGRGRMVPEFEKVSYELQNGEISEPFETAYGVHIVKKLDSRQVGSYEDEKNHVKAILNDSPKASVALMSGIDKLKKQYRLMRNVELMNKLKAEVTTPDSLNDAFVDKYKNSNETLFELNGKAYPLSLAIKENLKQRGRMADEVAYSTLEGLATQAETNAVIELEKQMLEENDPDFKNLMNEYRDGMLLFEISNRKVWDKAATDTAGLRAYFEANRAKYKWDSPKYKGYLIQTTGDSVTRLVKERISQLEPDSMVMKLRKEFSKDMRITKVLVAKGENPRVDSEVFGAEKVKPTDKYTDYFVYGGKLLAKPEEVSDVRGPVVSDYQNQLETEWVEWLRKEYPVEVDEKVLKSVK